MQAAPKQALQANWVPHQQFLISSPKIVEAIVSFIGNPNETYSRLTNTYPSVARFEMLSDLV